MAPDTPVIIDAVRSRFGRRGGIHAGIRPDDLLSQTMRACLSRSKLPADALEDVVVGCVTQAGEQGANLARLSALLAGFPQHVGGVTLNRMCGSGQQAVHVAAQAIAAGDARYVMAGGVESMSRVPMFFDVTLGAPFRNWKELNPALDPFALLGQAESAERLAEKFELSRSELDRFSMDSHAKAMAASRLSRQRATLTGGVDDARDEGIREHIDPDKMSSLAPIVRPGGRVTAGNSSQIADGAAAILIGELAAARADGLVPRARFRARVSIGSDPSLQLDGVLAATDKALSMAGVALADVDWVELNEAFASVPLAWCRHFKVAPEAVNPWGGAIAHGHPLGATGAGLIAKTLAGLEDTDGTFGLVVFCAAHGMAMATLLERI